MPSPTGRCCACELRDGISDPAPNRCAVMIAVSGKLVRACGAFRVGVLAVALEHQGRGAPDVDFKYHVSKVICARSLNGYTYACRQSDMTVSR
jgi:hypothetical protein